MHTNDFTLPLQYVRQITDQITRMGAAVPEWVKQRKLTEPGHGEAAASLSFDDFQRLIRDAIALTQEPALGLLVGERLLVNSHGMLGFAAMNSSSIRQALGLLGSFFQLRTTLVSARHEIVAGEIRLIFEETIPLGDVRRPVLEAVVLTVKNLVDYITMGSYPVTRAVFPFAKPAYADLAQDLFNCELRWGQRWAGFTMPAHALDAPLPTADPAAFQQAMLICQRELDNMTQPQSWAARIRRVMLEKQSGFPSLKVTARLFHLTPHTLHRRLQNEGSSYRDILEEVRHTLAVAHLRTHHLSIQEIAFDLGYTDLANFRRAFKRWEGVSPSAFRAQHEA